MAAVIQKMRKNFLKVEKIKIPEPTLGDLILKFVNLTLHYACILRV